MEPWDGDMAGGFNQEGRVNDVLFIVSESLFVVPTNDVGMDLRV
jgi:hypothetical protein